MTAAISAVFDCNVYLQAILSTRGAAHACWQRAVAGEVRLYASAYVIAEIRRLPAHRKLRTLRQLTPERVEAFIDELLGVATLAEPDVNVIQIARDSADSHYVNLAIATGGLLVVSNDKDLLRPHERHQC